MYEERVNSAAAKQRWEYRCEPIESLDDLENALNEAGDHFWELVDVLETVSATLAIYKRPRRLFSKPQPSLAEASLARKAK